MALISSEGTFHNWSQKNRADSGLSQSTRCGLKPCRVASLSLISRTMPAKEFCRSTSYFVFCTFSTFCIQDICKSMSPIRDNVMRITMEGKTFFMDINLERVKDKGYPRLLVYTHTYDY